MDKDYADLYKKWIKDSDDFKAEVKKNPKEAAAKRPPTCPTPPIVKQFLNRQFKDRKAAQDEMKKFVRN